jgi:hypothetical protein
MVLNFWANATPGFCHVLAFDRGVLDRICAPDINRSRLGLGLPPVKRIIGCWMHSPQGGAGAISREGGHVHGRDEVRSYWKRQWALIDPHVEPVEILPNGKGEVVVKVHQVVRDPRGNLLADRLVMHVFQIRNGLIQRFDIREA